MEFFQKKKLSEHVTCVTDITGVHSYLIEGTKKAALIDTGTGTGNMKVYVESLTSLPITVILTHGHCDHAGGDALFDEVWLNEADYKLVKRHTSMEMKVDYVRFTAGDLAKELAETDFMPQRIKGYLPLKDGQIFDLGEITLEIIAVCGHTRGMCCVLIKEERSIIFGDACNPAVFMWDEEAATIPAYRERLLHLKEKEDCYDIVYLSHGQEPIISKELLESVITVCDDILLGKADNQPFDFMGEEGICIAKATGPDMMRVDGGLGNIVYRPEKL